MKHDNWATNEMINWIIDTPGFALYARMQFEMADRPVHAASNILRVIPDWVFQTYDKDGSIIADYTSEIDWQVVCSFLNEDYDAINEEYFD